MGISSLSDVTAIESVGAWSDRDVPVTVYEMLENTAKKYPNSNAMSYQITSGPNDKAETLTWNELLEKTCQTANMFRSLGIGSNDVVAYVLPNANETLLAFIGGMVAGKVNPINPLLEAEQIGAILRETNAKVVVTLKAFPKTDVGQKTAQAVKLAPNVKTVLEVDLNRYLAPPKSWIVPLIRPKNPVEHSAQVLDFNKTMASHNKTLDFEDVREDRVAALFHTGGTTGMPKVAQHKYSGMVYNGWIGSELLLSEQDNILCPLPLFHVMACHVIVMSAVASGAHVIFPTPAGYRGDGVFDNFWKLVERWKVTFMVSVPTALSALMQRPVDADISTIKQAFSGSAPLPMELFKRFEEATGVEILEGYGMTEATCIISGNPGDGIKKVGSVGIRFPYTEIRIVKMQDGELVECDVDEVGEICLNNPGVWPGNTYTEAAKNKDLYYKDIFLRTGDLGRLDSDNYLWITGRAKDLIIRGGHNIDPALIEEALLGHEAVAFAGAIGQPDAHAGEVPCVYVELIDGANVSEDELISFACKHVSERAAHPKYLEVLDELPKTAVGKVFKPDLRKSAIKRIFNAALAEAGVSAKVESVIDDKKRGLVAQISGAASDEEITKTIGSFANQWERIS